MQQVLSAVEILAVEILAAVFLLTHHNFNAYPQTMKIHILLKHEFEL